MTRRCIYIIILSIVALISLVVVLPRASRVETYQRYIQSIDQKKDEVTVLSVSSATASALISVLPEDTATPIADELADLSKTFLTVLTVLYAEKYLFPIIGVVSSGILIPFSCLLAIMYILKPNEQKFKDMAIRIAVLAIASILIVPAATWTTDTIDKVFKESRDNVFHRALEGEKELQELKEERDAEGRNIFQKIGDTISGLWRDVTEGAKRMIVTAKESISYYIEAIAVILVEDCVVPILVLFVYAMLIKYVFGLAYTSRDIRDHILPKRRRGMKRYKAREITASIKEKEM